jgi:hypothetical protein
MGDGAIEETRPPKKHVHVQPAEYNQTGKEGTMEKFIEQGQYSGPFGG